MKQFISEQLDFNAEKYGIQLKKTEYLSRFEELLNQLSKIGKIVILIDEYDKPIIDHLTKPELSIEMREILKGFYTIIKASDEYIRFALLTGVSKFSPLSSPFEGDIGGSGLNNLNDISMNQKYSAIAGITEEELRNNFKEYITEFSIKLNISEYELLEKIRHWYNGYCFSGECERVYNPFSTLLLLENREFKNYWFETGTPSFLIDFLKKDNFPLPDLERVEMDAQHFSTYEIEHLEPIPLLFQTGYLTIREIQKDLDSYVLGYPNYEVKTNIGRIDAVIEDRGIFLFEFKFNGTKEEALAQIKRNKYFEKYFIPSSELYLFGVEFTDQNVGEWVMESVQ